MPRYDYDCAACGRRAEFIHGVHDDSPSTCPACGGGPLKKAFAPPTIHFKGSGWAKKERRAVASNGAGRAADTGDPGESGATGGAVTDVGKDGAKEPVTPPAAAAESARATTDAGGTGSAAGKGDGEKRPAKATVTSSTSHD